jgi:hypothetical protein
MEWALRKWEEMYATAAVSLISTRRSVVSVRASSEPLLVMTSGVVELCRVLSKNHTSC